MIANIAWLAGEQLVEVAKHEYSWRFTFFCGGSVVTEQPWRLVTKDGVTVTSEDHGHPFGLGEPVDAAARVLTNMKGKKILEYRVGEHTSDLSLCFEGEVRLEFLTLSCGFEGWRAMHGADDVICLGGG